MKNFRISLAQRMLPFALLFVLSFPAQISAEEQKTAKDLVKLSLDELLDMTVVTATRTETQLSKVTKSISVVSRKDMEDAQGFFLPEMIDNVPGVYLKRNGGPGRLSSISMRGAGSRFTQFQYNGMPLRDAADTQYTLRAFTQDFYNGSNVDRIEVLKGTNSTLYGSQAMGGVINIITEKWKKGLNYESRIEVGDQTTFMKSDRLAYGEDDYYVDLNLTYIDTDGQRNSGEHDYDYENMGISTGAGVKLGENISLELTSLFFDNSAALNNNTPSLDANLELVKNQAAGDQHLENRIFHLGVFFNHKISPIWDYTLKGAYSETERHYFWSDVSGNQSDYNGDTTYIEMQHNIHPADWLTMIVGFDYEKAAYHSQEPLDQYQGIYDPVYSDYDWYVWDAFFKFQSAFLDETLLFDAGGRYNSPEEFGSEFLWEVSAAYIFDKLNTKIHGHAGTGYRTPSLYESYGGYLFMGELITIGNPDLEPEESVSYEIGVDQFLMEKKINLGITYFRIDFDSLIVYDMSLNKYKNATEAKTEGFESYLYLRPWKYLKLGVAYTHTNPEYKDNATGKWIRKEHFPKNKVNITASLYPTENLTAFCRLNWMSEKIVPLNDTNYNRVRWEEGDVTTLDLAVTYKISENADIWARVENLLDKDYTESGFTMPGRWVYGGVKLSF